MTQKRIFTLREAMDLLPRVQEITRDAVECTDEIAARLQSTDDARQREPLEQQYNSAVQDWAESILELGVEVKGLWLVDFDSGDGIYYCWRHPEPSLEYFHEYEAGFAGRRPLGDFKIH